MTPKRVLFICTHNSARSPMAEAWLKRIGGPAFEVESAGLESGTLKPLAIEVMREVGIDLSGKTTQTVAEVLNAGRQFDYVIILCDPQKAERCPTFPGKVTRLYWDIPERPKSPAPVAEQLAHVRSVRDLIKEHVEAWIAENL
ncbi:MAG: arsenate reductase ArsC [Alphaproteobacteria bacterium]|nr:arsenate reductase ArsC [Alphaproteobacteria bacterium]